MALQQMIDKKNTFLFIWWILSSFLPRTNVVHSAFEDCPLWDKVCKIATNHPHLFSVGDDRKFV